MAKTSKPTTDEEVLLIRALSPDDPALKARKEYKSYLRERLRFNTFEARIEELETVCKNTPAAWPNREPDALPEERSRAWYAEKILSTMGTVQTKSPHMEAL